MTTMQLAVENETYKKALPEVRSKLIKSLVPQSLTDVSTKIEKIENIQVINLQKNAEIYNPIYIRQSIKIIGSGQNNDEQKFEWITVSQNNFYIENCNMKALIQVTARGHIDAVNCTFMPVHNENETVIEIFANSTGTFRNCTFKLANVTNICVRDCSSVEIIDCTFELNKSSLFVLNRASAIIKNSLFKDTTQMAIYAYDNAKAEIESCNFSNIKGKAIFSLKRSSSNINNCTFSECTQSVLVAELSKTLINNCQFNESKTQSAYAMKMSQLEVLNSTFIGGGVAFDDSKGSVSDCQFNQLTIPALYTSGPASVPIIKNCQITNSHSFAISIRDCSRPIVYNVLINNCCNDCISISDFSMPLIKNCEISNVEKSSFSVTNGAKPTITYCQTKDCNQFADIITYGHPTFSYCNVSGNIKTHHRGIFEENDFNNNYKQINSESNQIINYEIVYKDNEIIANKKIIETPIIPTNEEELIPLEEINPETIDYPEIETDKKQICMFCHEHEANCALSPCGHILMCSKCKEEMVKLPKESRPQLSCPLCHNVVTTVSKVYSSDRCVICFDKPNTISLPCGHASLCYIDAIACYRNGKACPECRSRMSSYKYMFPTTE